MMKYSSNRKMAFSLVEVTIALGILAFGLIAMLGVLPTGLRLVKESADEAAAANIALALQAEILSAPAAAFAPTNPALTKRYELPLSYANAGTALFTKEGKWLGNGGSYPDAAYAAKWAVRDRTSSSPPTVLISVGWPALAAEPAGTVEVLLVLPQNPQATP